MGKNKERLNSHNIDLSAILADIQKLPPAGGEDLQGTVEEQTEVVNALWRMVNRKVADHKGEGEYVWERYAYDVETSTKGEFITYVLAIDSEAYVDGAVNDDGYWYELIVSSGTKVAEYGMFFDAVNTSGYPTDMRIVMPKIIAEFMMLDSVTFTKLLKLEIIASSIGNSAFSNLLYASTTTPNVKLKTKSIGAKACMAWGNKNSRSINYWISSECTSIAGTDGLTSPFYQVHKGSKIYCEANSKPSGWKTYWNCCDSSTTLTTTWGVTEEQFDAL